MIKSTLYEITENTILFTLTNEHFEITQITVHYMAIYDQIFIQYTIRRSQLT